MSKELVEAPLSIGKDLERKRILKIIDMFKGLNLKESTFKLLKQRITEGDSK